MSRFWVEKVTELQPYVPGEQPGTGSVVKLNTNEHALSPSGAVMAAVSAVQGEQLRRYPDPDARGLCDAIAAVEGLTAACVFPGNGSDEVLAHLWFAFLSGRTVRTLDTTYGFYPVWAKLYSSRLVEVPVLEDFSVDVGVLEADKLSDLQVWTIAGNTSLPIRTHRSPVDTTASLKLIQRNWCPALRRHSPARDTERRATNHLGLR